MDFVRDRLEEEEELQDAEARLPGNREASRLPKRGAAIRSAREEPSHSGSESEGDPNGKSKGKGRRSEYHGQSYKGSKGSPRNQDKGKTREMPAEQTRVMAPPVAQQGGVQPTFIPGQCWWCAQNARANNHYWSHCQFRQQYFQQRDARRALEGNWQATQSGNWQGPVAQNTGPSIQWTGANQWSANGQGNGNGQWRNGPPKPNPKGKGGPGSANAANNQAPKPAAGVQSSSSNSQQ